MFPSFWPPEGRVRVWGGDGEDAISADDLQASSPPGSASGLNNPLPPEGSEHV